ncbi:MAG: polysaccharide deacetylase family protein, partial [Thermoleophilia bacterium]|nr:polysaccharide deacetylase family protein [Thermoleophilia bacterium]
MNKQGTVAASAAVCAGLLATGHLADRRRERKPIAATMGIGLGAAYLAGTYLQNLPLFGAVAHPRVAHGDMRFSLTFDDGPDPRHTPAISTLLAERGHRATFFALGRAARAHPALIRQLASDGHEIACHGEDHRLLAFAPPRAIVA